MHSYRYILSVVIFVSACSDSSNTSHSTTPPKPKIQLSEVQPAKQIVKPFVKYEDKMLAGDTIKLDFTVLAPSAVVDYMDSSVGVFKSKYETTREWTERFSNSIKEPYYETLQLSDKIAFKMEVRDILEYQYNADNEEVKFTVKASSGLEGWWHNDNFKKHLSGKTYYLPIGGSVNTSNVVGQNAFGVEKNVIAKSGHVYGLSWGPSTPFSNGAILGKMKIPHSDAQDTIINIKAILIFQPMEPYVIKNSAGHSATMNNPEVVDAKFSFLYGAIRGLVLYDSRDLKVLYRYPSNFPIL